MAGLDEIPHPDLHAIDGLNPSQEPLASLGDLLRGRKRMTCDGMLVTADSGTRRWKSEHVARRGAA